MLLDLPSNRLEGWRWSDLTALPALAEAQPSGRVPDGLPWIEAEHEAARLPRRLDVASRQSRAVEPRRLHPDGDGVARRPPAMRQQPRRARSVAV